KRGLRIGILVGVMLAGGALAFAGAQPEGFLTVTQALDDPAHRGRDVDVKATVVEGSLDRNATPVAFEIADGARVLAVRWDPAVPLPDHEAGGTIEGKSVVVRGTLLSDASGTYLLAREMTVGCASKYRPADQ
ncbi:MAG TPA: cytochrome c maturation protein CcmE, partial [Candidatus Thermoplasmatota archaeon]|nr:cytochrome c maturation protein CcmE [Candidatus Thermoplasmatota archaeon]